MSKRRMRQGVPWATQERLLDRAAEKRDRKAERKRTNNHRTRLGQRRALRRLKVGA